MKKHDDHFTPEQIDEQIEALTYENKNSSSPEGFLVSDLQQVYEEKDEMAERIWERLTMHIDQQESNEHAEDQSTSFFKKKIQSNKAGRTFQHTNSRWRVLETLVALLIVALLVGSMVLLFQGRQFSQANKNSTQSASAGAVLATGTPEVPTTVKLQLSAPGIAATTSEQVTVPAGTKVTLTIIPDHPLQPFQIFTMGIYATDPYAFSELEYCTYPKTDTCSYVIAYSSSEQTDYTKGKHTFQAFLGNIGGAILSHSNSITVTWS